MEQFYTLLTDVGKAKIANATALETKVKFTKLLVGDGGGNYYEPTESQTKLKNKVWEGGIGNISIDKDNLNWIVLESVIPSSVGGFTIREVGIVDEDGDLVVIAKYPETYKPKIEDGSTKDLIVKTILEVSNTSSVTLKVDPTVILATKKDIQILSNDLTNFKQAANTQLADITKDIKNIDLSADKVTLDSTKLKSKDVKTALEELFQYADNGKRNWVDVIGSPLSTGDSFSTLKSKTQTLKNTFASNLNSKKVSASGTEDLSSLIDKIKNINTGLKYATGILEEELSRFTIRNLSFRPVHIFLIDMYYDGPGCIKKYYSSSYNVSVGSSKTAYNAFEIYDDGFALVNVMTYSKAGSIWVAFGE
ncbi:phage tail protein [Clostridium tetani]|uniref:phage tail protein n=1 Tax=Clostridium tetani TaxID=1513 RepID=UPI00102699A2|nr:phage tail protein [Clostridium tetani]RXI70492.1 phage tail protein [Clostridium tetani]